MAAAHVGRALAVVFVDSGVKHAGAAVHAGQRVGCLVGAGLHRHLAGGASPLGCRAGVVANTGLGEVQPMACGQLSVQQAGMSKHGDVAWPGLKACRLRAAKQHA